MNQLTILSRLLTTPPLCLLPIEFFQRLLEPIKAICQLVHEFRQLDPTPQSTCEFEQKLFCLLREFGKQIVEWTYNNIEPDSRDELPTQIQFDGAWYQRNDRQTPNRYVATLFGTITLMRFLYRPIEERMPSIFPLEIRLGLEAGRATPALADCVARFAATCTQQAVLDILRRDHDVSWSVDLLRKVTASISVGMSEHLQEAQAAKLLTLLDEAFASRGSRKVILAVGRDGIFVPIRKQPCYREGAVGTVSVFDRRGRRLGTVYLGRMPEEGQHTLSRQLTTLIRQVLTEWTGPLPRLVYLTDAGYHPTEYYEKVLCRMPNPRRPGHYLEWEWVLDYYHACQYISKLSEALFGAGQAAHAWAAKMRRWLKYKPQGIYRVLHSAAALRHRRDLVGSQEAYDKAYNYLRQRIGHLDYYTYRRLHLPIGSGITEAACKTVFTQRLKQSGMSWGVESGQVIVDLRVIHLSGVWEDVRRAYLAYKDPISLQTQLKNDELPLKNAA